MGAHTAETDERVASRASPERETPDDRWYRGVEGEEEEPRYHKLPVLGFPNLRENHEGLLRDKYVLREKYAINHVKDETLLSEIKTKAIGFAGSFLIR